MNVKTVYPKERLPYFEWIAYLKQMKAKAESERLEQEIKDKQKRKY